MVFEAIIYKINILVLGPKSQVSFWVVIPKTDTIAVIKDVDSIPNLFDKYGIDCMDKNIDINVLYNKGCVIDFDGKKYSFVAI